MAVAPPQPWPQVRARVAGAPEATLHAFLEALLAPHGIDVALTGDGEVDLQVVVVQGEAIEPIIGEALRRAPDAPLVALLPFGAPDQQAAALRSGAALCHALDDPVTALERDLVRLLGR